MDLFLDLFGNVLSFTWQQGIMIAIGAILVFLAIKLLAYIFDYGHSLQRQADETL